MYLLGKLITTKQLSNGVLLLFSLAVLFWVGYDALDGSLSICSRYGGGCFTRVYSGQGDYGYYIALSFALLVPTLLGWLSWRGLKERTRDLYKKSSHWL